MWGKQDILILDFGLRIRGKTREIEQVNSGLNTPP
jgi:hypothetical protein